VSGPIVLCYHAISDRWPAPLAVRPQDLEEHVALLTARSYESKTFSDAVRRPSSDKALAITFDDAFRSVFDLAFPILSRAGFRATVFAPTGFIGSDEPMRWPGIDQWFATEHREELAPMSWEELRTLADAGWEVGSHSRRHPHLPRLGQEALEEELVQSRQDIERRLGRPCCSLSYPFGDYEERIVQTARRAGYTAAAGTARWGLYAPSSTLDWPRTVVSRVDGPRRFRLKISPRMRWLRGTVAWRLLIRARRGTRKATAT